MKTRKIFGLILSFALLATATTVPALAFTKVEAASGKATALKTKPRVVIIRADWCTACQQLEPTMMGLMQEYGAKLDFVILDVTTDETTAQSAAKAKSLGLISFFEANKRMTSTVAVFKGKKTIFKTAKNFNRSDYVSAFNKALE